VQNDAIVVMHVAVYDIVGPMLAQERSKPPPVEDKIARAAHVNARSEVPDLVIVRARLICMYQEIELKAPTIYIPQHMHQPSLSSASVHT
jgi:hypothetical protein